MRSSCIVRVVYNDCQAVIVGENACMSMIVTMIIAQTRIGPTAAHIDRYVCAGLVTHSNCAARTVTVYSAQ